MSNGSGLLTIEQPLIPHHATAGKEVGDLRRDLERQLGPLVAETIEEYIDPVAAATNSVLLLAAGIISSLAEQVLLPGDLDGAMGAVFDYPRQLTVTTGGVTPAHSPASMSVKFKDAKGRLVTEVLALGQIAGTDTTTGFIKEIISITIPLGTGIAATFIMGNAAPIGLSSTPKSRAGGIDLIWEKESTLGVVVTGAIATAVAAPPYGSYTPITVPDGAEDYAIRFEFDPTLV